MKTQFSFLWISVFAATAICFGQTSSPTPGKPTASEEAIINLEKSVTEAYKNKKTEAFRKFLAKNYVGINADGITKVDTEVTGMENTDLRSFSFADVKVVFPKAGVAVITYKTTVQSSAGGQDTSGTYNVASVWAKRWGNWSLISHSFVKSQ
ncbi:MAG TPA: nuclear transport factor 2 family protein [Pyrinomonadaceae bacterium]|jgi:Domain of unknown function (DUF4440)|nr:nuclear transport factor 2 family protein [Pyrinomonadaceae bacterium]